MHVVVSVLNRPVEIQVRTQMQHKWAELFEKLADKWGRGMRYGDMTASSPAEAEVIHRVKLIADRIDSFEKVQILQRTAAAELRIIDQQLDALRAMLLEQQ